jgi:hypothetical protein
MTTLYEDPALSFVTAPVPSSHLFHWGSQLNIPELDELNVNITLTDPLDIDFDNRSIGLYSVLSIAFEIWSLILIIAISAAGSYVSGGRLELEPTPERPLKVMGMCIFNLNIVFIVLDYKHAMYSLY